MNLACESHGEDKSRKDRDGARIQDTLASPLSSYQHIPRAWGRGASLQHIISIPTSKQVHSRPKAEIKGSFRQLEEGAP